MNTNGTHTTRSSNGLGDIEEGSSHSLASPTGYDAPKFLPGGGSGGGGSFITETGAHYRIRQGRQICRQSTCVRKLLLAFCAAVSLIVVGLLGYLLFLGRGHKKMAHSAFTGAVFALMMLAALIMIVLRRPYGEAVITVILVVCTGFFVIQQLDDLME